MNIVQTTRHGRDDLMCETDSFRTASKVGATRGAVARRLRLISCLFCLGWANLIAGQTQPASENEVKAAYLYNFAHSAQWPDAIVPADNAPFTIGVVGGDGQFLDVLRAVLQGRTVASHPLLAKAANSESEMRSCRLLFFHREKKGLTPSIASLQSGAILLVGEESSFLRQGGMINLYLENGRIRFEVNREALDRAGIRLSPDLLQLAKDNDSPAKTARGEPRQLRSSRPPLYPELAQRLNLRGPVHLELVVRPDGSVKDVRVLGGNPVLVEALWSAVMYWKYEAATQETRERVDYSFNP